LKLPGFQCPDRNSRQCTHLYSCGVLQNPSCPPFQATTQTLNLKSISTQKFEVDAIQVSILDSLLGRLLPIAIPRMVITSHTATYHPSQISFPSQNKTPQRRQTDKRENIPSKHPKKFNPSPKLQKSSTHVNDPSGQQGSSPQPRLSRRSVSFPLEARAASARPMMRLYSAMAPGLLPSSAGTGGLLDKDGGQG